MDAMAILDMVQQQGREKANAPDEIDTEAIRPAQRIPTDSGRVISFDSIPRRPGDPGWNERIPPAEKWDPEENVARPTAGVSLTVTEAMNGPAAPALKRVAVYLGRGEDQFVVSIEDAPDWDTAQSYKLDTATTLVVVAVAKALGVKVSDKTGGDLAEAARDEASG